eukprot:COSAG02_NODE_36814_length_450_cov_0.726496_2_plen_77_part_01
MLCHACGAEEKRKQTGIFADGKNQIVWSEVYHPVKESEATPSGLRPSLSPPRVSGPSLMCGGGVVWGRGVWVALAAV